MKFFDWNSNVEKDMNIVYSSIEELDKKMEGLYKFDHHDTERPKVDLLADRTDAIEERVYLAISKLQDRIRDLEKKK